jgi:hypothetical protein
MRLLKALVPFGISLILTPFALLVGVGTAIEGDLYYTKIVFPYTILLICLVRSISTISIDSFFGVLSVLTVIQYLIYGMILSGVERKGRAAVILIAVHLCCLVLSFIISYLIGL